MYRWVICLTVREEHIWSVFKNKMVWKIFVPKRDLVAEGWRKLHNEDLPNSYSSPSIMLTKSRWDGRGIQHARWRWMQSFLAIWRFILQYFPHMNLARHLHVNSLIQNFPNKIQHNTPIWWCRASWWPPIPLLSSPLQSS